MSRLNTRAGPRVLYGMSTYPLSLGDRRVLIGRQRGKCAICRVKPKKRLVVDHCHATGRVRELLCGPCNCAIGFLRDSPTTARRAMLYLRRHRSRRR